MCVRVKAYYDEAYVCSKFQRPKVQNFQKFWKGHNIGPMKFMPVVYWKQVELGEKWSIDNLDGNQTICDCMQWGMKLDD